MTCRGHVTVSFQVEIDYFASWREGGVVFLRVVSVKQWKTLVDEMKQESELMVGVKERLCFLWFKTTKDW